MELRGSGGSNRTSLSGRLSRRRNLSYHPAIGWSPALYVGRALIFRQCPTSERLARFGSDTHDLIQKTED
jgi:hypothetical protein